MTWFRGQPAAGASDAEIADWFRQQPAGGAAGGGSEWFRGQPAAGASDAEIADWFRQQPAGGAAGGGSEWFRGQPAAGASDAEIADWFRQQPAGGAGGGGSEWFRGQPAAGASDAEIADWFRQQPAATAGKQSIDDPQGITVLDERAVILEGVAPWDMVLHEWFRVRDVNNSGDFDEEEYVHLNRRMHPRYFDDNVPFDEQKHREKFKSMDTNQVSCIWPALVVLLARANQYSYAACCGCTGKCLCSAGW